MVFYAQRKGAYCLRSLRKIIMRFAHACLCKAQDYHPKSYHGFPKENNQRLLKSKILNALACLLLFLRSKNKRSTRLSPFGKQLRAIKIEDFKCPCMHAQSACIGKEAKNLFKI